MRQNKEWIILWDGYISWVNAGLGHHIRIYYYEDINIFIMKRADKESEIYDGSYYRYVK